MEEEIKITSNLSENGQRHRIRYVISNNHNDSIISIYMVI